jgi:hypothetical protein
VDYYRGEAETVAPAAQDGERSQEEIARRQVGSTRTTAETFLERLSSHSVGEGISMRKLWFVLLLSGSFVLAQDKPSNPGQEKSKVSKGQVTVQGCVGTSSGDYTLFKQDPAMTYELEATGKSKIKLGQYLGQQVEVSGWESPSLSTSSDYLTRTSPSSVTLTITSIKTIKKWCTLPHIPE